MAIHRPIRKAARISVQAQRSGRARKVERPREDAEHTRTASTARIDERLHASQVSAPELKSCPSCGKRAGEVKRSELPSRFPFYVKCSACGHSTEPARIAAAAVALWNATRPAAARRRK